MTLIKIKLLIYSFYLYLLGKKIYRYKSRLSCFERLDNLSSKKLITISNNYQKLLKKWILKEKQVLFLRGFFRLKNNFNL